MEKTAKERMLEAQKIREQQEKEKEEKGSNKGFQSDINFDEIAYLSLEDKKEKVFRIVGDPFEIRKTPYDSKLILWSQILKDDEKGYMHVIWPYVEKNGDYVPDPDWILTRFYNKVKEGKWQKYENGMKDERGKEGKWSHFHEDTQIYKIIEGNARKDKTEKFPKNFYPSKKVMMNIIDRGDTWCFENKHTKILRSGEKPYTFENEKNEKMTIVYGQTGIPFSTYAGIFDHFSKISSHFEDTDCILVKESAKKAYLCWDKGDKRYISDEAYNLANDLEMTVEEKSYERYDLDKYFSICSYAKLKRNLSARFKLCDLELGTHFYDELIELYEKEATEKLNSKEVVEDKPLQVQVAKSEIKEDQKRRKIDTKEDISILCKENFPYWEKYTEEEKNIYIEGISGFNGKIPVYKRETDISLCSDVNCFYVDTKESTAYPNAIKACPICGKM